MLCLVSYWNCFEIRCCVKTYISTINHYLLKDSFLRAKNYLISLLVETLMIKKVYQITYLVALGIMIVSCNKDTVPNIDESTAAKDTEVYAGVYDTTFTHHQFTSPVEIAISWDAQNLYSVGYDSLDIDSDGIYDLYFTLNLLNEDSLHLLNGMPDPFPSCSVSSLNGFEVAFYSESYLVGMGQYATADFADRLELNERIDLLSDWDTDLKMWGENPGGAGTSPFGDWYSASSQNYLAIRLNNEKFGWVEVDAFNPKNPKFISFAIQN